MAPEVLDCPFKNKPEENKEKTHLHYDLTVDTWAVGVLTYEVRGLRRGYMSRETIPEELGLWYDTRQTL